MAQVFAGFISTTYLKDNTPILGYVNEDELRTFIRPAQDTHIQRVLGTTLYNRLMNGVINSNLDSDEDSLLRNYIQPALMYWVVYEYILYSNYKFTNKAVSQQSSNESTPSSLSDVNYLKTNIRNWAEWYNERLTDYLRDNTSTFSEYLQGGSGFSNKHPENNSFFWGMYIPNQLGNRCPDPTPWDTIKLYW